ncbi:MAG TPA: hypothetical protein VK668_18955 [Mucilaginibacter sp.]|nr:hypothetical protein [Mucilaginibacter sp.]
MIKLSVKRIGVRVEQLVGFVILVTFLNCGCNTPEKTYTKTIYIKDLKPINLDNRELINITLFKCYPIKIKYNGDKRYVNLYVCRDNELRDTLFVFESSATVPDYADNGSKFKNVLSIAATEIKDNHPDSVFVDLPPQINISPGSNYVFATLRVLEE